MPPQPHDPAGPDAVSRREFIRAAVAAGAVAGLAPAADARLHPAGSARQGPMPAEGPAGTTEVQLHVNGRQMLLNIEPRVTLLDALRDHVGLTGTKKGCAHGQCGACTVLVNNRRINACMTLAIMHQHDQVTTIEGLADGDALHPMQAAFIEADAFQCGYCTPGQICSAIGLLHEGHARTDADIREQMSGNICRCGAYPHIVEAVRKVMQTPAT